MHSHLGEITENDMAVCMRRGQHEQKNNDHRSQVAGKGGRGGKGGRSVEQLRVYVESSQSTGHTQNYN